MNALTLLKQDHNNVDALFTRFEQLGQDDAAEKREVVDKIIEHLAVHAAIEEQVFYPAVREQVEGSNDIVLEALEEHHVAKLTLSELEKMAPTDERFDAKVRVLIESVRHHATEEEEELFPKVRDALTNEQLNDIGEALDKAKETAPTRPHPFQPDVPPLNVLLGLPVAMLDRAIKTGRDAVEKALSRNNA
jgi:hemerythrin superfamily protein